MKLTTTPMRSLALIPLLAGLGLTLTGCFGNKSSEDKPKDLYSSISDYKGGKVAARIADKNIGDMTKEMTFPLKASNEINITNVSAESFLYGDGTGTVNWKASLENTSEKEVEATINICDSSNATMKIDAPGHYYLVDCEPIQIRYAPKAVSRGEIQFATSRPWTSAKGSMARLCIKDVGCVERFIGS